jgi:hypothetical protein
MRISISLGLLLSLATFASAEPQNSKLGQANFRRISTFPVVLNTCAGQPASCLNTQSVSEIVAASEDGQMLLYTDSAGKKLGFVDIANAAQPAPAGFLSLPGEPTSVAVVGPYALVVVDTSTSFTNPSGQLRIIHIATKVLVRTIELDGQPDSIAVSKNHRYATIAIENQRDETLCVGGTRSGEFVSSSVCRNGGGVLGGLPQGPAGFLVIVDLVGAPSSWTMRNVSLTGYATLFPQDPEPEYIDISEGNVATVTLQENNHIVLVNLVTGTVVNHFSAGIANISQLDTSEALSLIELTGSIDLRREPDGVAWISNNEFAIANEGDLFGGTRGFTVFNKNGFPLYESGNLLDHAAVRTGHYPEARSENKGNEPENIKYAKFGSQEFLFVASERSSVVFVFGVRPNADPEFLQTLPSAVGPEGMTVIESRNLLITASEEDNRANHLRASLTIYRLIDGEPTYPKIESDSRPDGTPIPWGALSALAAHPTNPTIAYTVHDAFFVKSRIYELDLSGWPARITREIVLRDGTGANLNLDLEGIALRAGGGFWVASEGGGACTAPSVCNSGTKNFLYAVDATGLVTQTVGLPAAVDGLQVSNGFEGVASVGSGDAEYVYVAFQRPWLNDPSNKVRIGRYHVASNAWTFMYYPLDPVASPFGGNIGLSELVALDANRFLVIERDNQAGIDARVKRIYGFNINGVSPQPQGSVFPDLIKTLVRDLVPDLAPTNGHIIEKVEGLAVLANGDLLVETDNDGVNNTNGETQLINLGNIPFAF